jgi:rare lipoprotein A
MNKQIVLTFFAGVLLASNVYATHENYLSDTVVSKRKHKAPGKIQYGTASFYANKFNGRRTANGDIFSQQKLTAASNTLPLNTWVRVTNLRNKKSVFVRITDRMHWRNKRLIDLSKAAAHKLGYTGWGLAHVRIDVIGRRKPAEANLAEDK